MTLEQAKIDIFNIKDMEHLLEIIDCLTLAHDSNKFENIEESDYYLNATYAASIATLLTEALEDKNIIPLFFGPGNSKDKQDIIRHIQTQLMQYDTDFLDEMLIDLKEKLKSLIKH